MPRAAVIAAVRENPFTSAISSAANSMHLLSDLMYGTRERTRLTYALAMSLAFLGYSLNVAGAHAMQVCPLPL